MNSENMKINLLKHIDRKIIIQIKGKLNFLEKHEVYEPAIRKSKSLHLYE